jgi:hypothetical protein
MSELKPKWDLDVFLMTYVLPVLFAIPFIEAIVLAIRGGLCSLLWRR